MLNSDYFRFDNLANFVGLFVVIFSVLITLYSLGFMRQRKGLFRYYLYIILTMAASLGAVFSNNLILFMVFWGFLGLLLYLLIGFGEKKNTTATAKKTFIIVGGADALMLLGLAFIWHLAGTLQMDKMSIALNNKLAIWAYLCFAAGAFAKAGAMPLHTWIPDTAEDAPTPVTAYLPASLDKLLGIYFLVRISLDMFVMSEAMNIFLMFIGAFTIIAAVMMALVQQHLKRLLSYLMISGAGYMLLGLGTGNPLGIAGGLFYMLNSAIWTNCLFLAAGSVEYRCNAMDLDRLGGLAKSMPITFFSCLIAGLSISGVPPFNGFVSKWMVYQGVIESGKTRSGLWVVWLVAAIFGSALTLASFVKAIHAVFMGQPSSEQRSSVNNRRETGPTMWIPTVTLATLCVVFGVFAYQIPLKFFVFPSLGRDVTFSGLWSANLATALILIGIVVGIVIYLLGTATKTRTADIFVGGETLKDQPDMRVSGIEFYNTVREIGILKGIYNKAEAGLFDIYVQAKNIVFGIGKFFQYLHNGVLSTYLVWTLLGMIGLFWAILR